MYQHLVNELSSSPQRTWSYFTRGTIRRTEIVSPLFQCSIPQYSNEMRKIRDFFITTLEADLQAPGAQTL